MKLLLVEDNVVNADMLSRRLERRGYAVVLATDGLDAVSSAKMEQPDLILMDMSLPEIDGWEATRRIKRDPSTSPIPVIALTAHALSSDRERALEAGCDDFETKPVDFNRLIDRIRTLVGPPRSEPSPLVTVMPCSRTGARHAVRQARQPSMLAICGEAPRRQSRSPAREMC